MLAIFISFLNSIIICRSEMEGFVVGGTNAEIEEFPHSTYLSINCYYPDGKGSNFVCGGSLVNQRIVLTAAHCFYRCAAGTTAIASVGHSDRSLGTKITGTGFVIHEGYVQFTNIRDIALLKLKREVTFGDKIKRVAIMKHPPYDEPAKLAGWGLINEVTHTGPLVMKKIDQMVWKLDACKATLSNVPKGTICASSKILNQFGSRGDSGSALMVRGYIQIGVVSYKTPLRGNNVVVYTDVGYYYDWITFNINKLYCFKNVNS